MKAHLLFRDRDFDFGADAPPNRDDVIQDLELSTLLAAMAGGDKFLLEVSTRVLLAVLEDPNAIVYRQRVLADCIAHPGVLRQMYAVAVGALLDRRSLWGGYGGHYQSPASSLSGAVSHLEAYVARLRQMRQIAEDNIETFDSDGLQTLLSELRHQLHDDYFEEVSAHLEQLRFRWGPLISLGLDRDNSPTGFVLRAPGVLRSNWRKRLGIGPRSSYSFTLPPRDEAGSQILQNLTGRGIDLVANTAAQSADHLQSYFAMLRWELGFYVACLNLHERLAEKAVPLCFPEPTSIDTRVSSCTDLRDASLALQSDGPVVGNDVEGDGRSLVIITGANSGGKSTFLRSFGIAQLMMQCGLFVAARAHRANVVHAVFTHFIREEDPEMTSGRLDEELRRMSEIADHVRPDCMVLFNESFAGTNEREGSEIARQVVRALLETDIKILFVTHRFDFAHSFVDSCDESTLFLRAERVPDGRRCYKLAAKEPLPTSFGEDLYYRLGAWFGESGSEASEGFPQPGH